MSRSVMKNQDASALSKRVRLPNPMNGPNGRVERFLSNPSRAWTLFAAAWAICIGLSVWAAWMVDRGQGTGLFAFLLLLVLAPAPVFAGFLLLPHAVPRIRARGRHEPWVIGYVTYVLVGALFALGQWLRFGYPLGGPFLLYAWPSFLTHEVGCSLELWSCLRSD